MPFLSRPTPVIESAEASVFLSLSATSCVFFLTCHSVALQKAADM